MKNNKNKKKINPKHLENLKLLGKSLINNESAIIGARRKGWWWALIMLLVSGLIAVIPSTVQAAKKDGSDFINQTNLSGYDVSFRQMVESFKADGIELTVKVQEDKKENYLELYKDGAVVNDKGTTPLYKHYNESGKLDFEAVYWGDELDATSLELLTKNRPEYDAEGKLTYVERNSSIVVFAKEHVVSYLYMTGNSTATSSIVGDYQSFKEDYKLTSVLGEGYTYDGTNAAAFDTYKAEVWENVKSFYSVAYKTTVINTTWKTTLVILAINYGVTMFMGLMVFILTRGKQNPFRIYTFWESQKIAYWASIAPGVLALFGFLIPNFAQVMFAMLVGIRVMWMSMKAFKPDNVNEVLLEEPRKVKTVKAK